MAESPDRKFVNRYIHKLPSALSRARKLQDSMPNRRAVDQNLLQDGFVLVAGQILSIHNLEECLKLINATNPDPVPAKTSEPQKD